MFDMDDFWENAIKIQQEIPEAEIRALVPAQDESFGDFIVRYEQNFYQKPDEDLDVTFQAINEVYGIIYVPLSQLSELEINSYNYGFIPKCYTYMDLESLNASGITRLQNHPYLGLKGRGTVIAVIDSGIDYEDSLFIDESGTRIAYIWDQTLEGDSGEEVPYGRLFTGEDIDRALLSQDPRSIVPTEDENGHGTALAAVAAGNAQLETGFSGAAPEAQLIIVKVKQAKQYLRDLYLFPKDAEMFQEDDLMMGIAFASRMARNLQMPLSICLGIGTSQGAHVGKNPLSEYVDYIAGFSQISVSVAAGNEGAARHHCERTLDPRSNSAVVELRVGEREKGFSLEFWGDPPAVYNISLQSPTGESLDISSSLGAVTQRLSFVFVETRVLVNFISMERQSGNTLVFFRFLNPAAGIWKITVYGKDSQNARFHMWLPVNGLISEDTYFLESSPYQTVTAPGDSTNAVTVTAYQYRDNSLYLQASRGYMPDGMITPQIAAPGVGIRVPSGKGQIEQKSGTSLAAAQTAGAAALLFEWAIIRENQPFFTGTSVKNYLQLGAKREERLQYPNPDWGYGRMDLYHTFELLT